jgi:uncharacterized protein YprB with RNaseH-like and TPR domain
MQKLNELRCIHRHSIYTHPACFAKGLIKQTLHDKPWYEEAELRIGYFDIETDGLKADFSTMLTWAIKEREGAVTTNSITKKELFNGVIDRRLVQDLVNELSKYNVIITYYGTLFDIPYSRAKALHYGLRFPEYLDLFHWDIYFAVRSLLGISRKSLDNACDYLGIEGKTPIDKQVWRDAKYGDPRALAKVVEHNIGDVIILEQLHDKLAVYKTWTRRSI